MPSREQLEKLLAADPEDVFLNFALAMELVKADDSEAALEQFARVTELDPDYNTAYFQRGRLLLSLGRVGDAREVLKAGVAAAERTGDRHAASQMGELLTLACKED
jgi:thioredoxin-like negative regulator of GroEL